ncbi:MAG: peptidase C45 [Chitinophagaceae bacterium]|nr:peptidase C45 [Chitinophagaceae bacterium]
MKWFKKVLKGFGYFILTLLCLLFIFCVYVYNISDIPEPKISDRAAEKLTCQVSDSNTVRIQSNWLHKNPQGLYEMYIEGDGFERGVIFGKLAKDLVRFQELAFTNEIQRMIPSPKYLKFLKYVVGFMNRDLADHVIDEYQQEIYGVSLSASQEFNWIGTNYTRQLNYHAAHDIGHALANMMLVGCTSFATWGNRSVDSQLILGRNFDFYVGDEFAKNKIVAFYKPTHGIPFMSVTWGGFTGVVSGMNQEGLTVTINANKSDIPTGAATPVSLVAREILQYASNIDEAIIIAKKRKMFVSESFMVGSAKDNKAVVIEKTPNELDVLYSRTEEILCTNHYQSKLLENQKLNVIQMYQSASMYRYARLKELLFSHPKNSPEITAQILRDYKGEHNADIGLTNEKALNQFIAHHSIIFEPQKKLVWVSSAPWQLGEYVCYDLNKIFTTQPPNPGTVAQTNLNIPADTILNTLTYKYIQQYLELEQKHIRHQDIDPMMLISINPTYYDAYRIAGDVFAQRLNHQQASLMYQKALTCEIATLDEKEAIEEKLKKQQSALK